MSPVTISVAYGDGIGPEIMEATLFMMEQAGAQIQVERVLLGLEAFEAGYEDGIHPDALRSLDATKILLKGPLATPQGKGFRSANVVLRGRLGLYANIRPCCSYAPYVPTQHPGMDLVVIRENEEDLYCGIEYRDSPDLCYALKMISASGSEKILRYAFAYARRCNRKRVTCLAKDNILKLTDGLFHATFDRIRLEYPEIESSFLIVDVGMAKIACAPEDFDVIVVPNLYGDILSDITAELSGSIGLVGTTNIGVHGALFEAIHGSAPRLAGQGIANPSGLLLGAIQMLHYIGQSDCAIRLHEAWLCTLEEGIHTRDLYRVDGSRVCVSTQEFAKSVVARLGKTPSVLVAPRSPICHPTDQIISTSMPKKELRGVDISIYAAILPSVLMKKLQRFPIVSIRNRGAYIEPPGNDAMEGTDQWRLRFLWENTISFGEILILLHQVHDEGWEVLSVHPLYHWDDIPGYSGGQLSKSAFKEAKNSHA